MDIVPGTYRHYKGGKYRVLFVADESTNARSGGQVVVYVSLTNGNIFSRDLSEFAETVTMPDGKEMPRFTFES